MPRRPRSRTRRPARCRRPAPRAPYSRRSSAAPLGADKEDDDAVADDDDDDDEDASGAAALLSAMRFALEAKSAEEAFAAVVETRVTIARWGLAEAQKENMDDRALKRALHAASRGLAAFATSEALADDVLASVEKASIALRDAADPPPALAAVTGDAPVPTAFPLFDRFNEIVDEDALAGGAAAVSIVRPADLGAPAPAKTVREVLTCLRAVRRRRRRRLDNSYNQRPQRREGPLAADQPRRARGVPVLARPSTCGRAARGLRVGERRRHGRGSRRGPAPGGTSGAPVRGRVLVPAGGADPRRRRE